MRIIEIIDRSAQGITQPFLCRAEDGELYYVKGRHAGYRALCCEWVAGELARRWELPVARFAIVEVPAALVRGSLREDALDLGYGPAFGSRLVPNASELRWHEVASGGVTGALRARVLLFDWWVANSDRMLSETGGNPNLLWSASEQSLILIDHNLAFTPEKMPPTLPEFAAEHVFGGDLLAEELSFWVDEASGTVPSLTLVSGELEQFWQDNGMALEEIWDALPEAWTEAAPEFTLEAVRGLLSQVEDDDFWGTSESAATVSDTIDINDTGPDAPSLEKNE